MEFSITQRLQSSTNSLKDRHEGAQARRWVTRAVEHGVDDDVVVVKQPSRAIKVCNAVDAFSKKMM